MTVPVVGLTGGIASGKSTVARVFAQRGIPIIDADILAREVVAPGSDGLAAIVETFGDVLLPDGTLDRKKVAAMVFADAALRMKLNAITHPRVAQLGIQRLAAIEPGSTPYAIYEAPLIVENGLHHGFQGGLIVVSLDPAVQLERVMARDNLDRESAEARLRAQAPLERKLAAATYVIDNGKALSELTPQVDAVHAQILSRLGENVR